MFEMAINNDEDRCVVKSLYLEYRVLLQNNEPQRAEILRDDLPWDKKGFRLKNFQIC